MVKLIRANRNFAIFLITQGFSHVGDSLRMVVMPLLVLELTGSALYVSAIALLETIPFFLVQLPFGALLDRWNRRTAMLVADVGRGLLILTIPVIWFSHGPMVATLFAIAVPLSILSSLFGAGSSAVLPGLVPCEDLAKAYAIVEAAESGAWVVGPMMAGAVGAWFGLANALIVDGLSFFVSALGLVLITVPATQAVQSAETIWAQIVGGFRFLMENSALRPIQIYWSLYGIIGYGAITGLLYAGSNGGTSGSALASFAVSAYAIGSLAGALVAARPKIAGFDQAIPLSLVAVSGGALLVASTLDIGILSGAFLIGAGEGFFLGLYLARRAEATPDHYRARIGTAASVLARVATGISVAWMGAALEWWQVSGAFGVMAVLALLLSDLTYRSAKSSREPVQDD